MHKCTIVIVVLLLQAYKLYLASVWGRCCAVTMVTPCLLKHVGNEVQSWFPENCHVLKTLEKGPEEHISLKKKKKSEHS